MKNKIFLLVCGVFIMSAFFSILNAGEITDLISGNDDIPHGTIRVKMAFRNPSTGTKLNAPIIDMAVSKSGGNGDTYILDKNADSGLSNRVVLINMNGFSPKVFHSWPLDNRPYSSISCTIGRSFKLYATTYYTESMGGDPKGYVDVYEKKGDSLAKTKSIDLGLGNKPLAVKVLVNPNDEKVKYVLVLCDSSGTKSIQVIEVGDPVHRFRIYSLEELTNFGVMFLDKTIYLSAYAKGIKFQDLCVNLFGNNFRVTKNELSVLTVDKSNTPVGCAVKLRKKEAKSKTIDYLFTVEGLKTIFVYSVTTEEDPDEPQEKAIFYCLKFNDKAFIPGKIAFDKHGYLYVMDINNGTIYQCYDYDPPKQ